ncbi:MAG: hypothetical protein Q8Q30_01670 [Candidatus Woesebacteria bacterium]|nr:hypothetical protein [Candidatus Woesebacteria bacterium]
MKKVCSSCSLATEVTKHFKKRKEDDTNRAETINSAAVLTEESWIFAIQRRCSVGGETAKDFDNCLAPREYIRRLP